MIAARNLLTVGNPKLLKGEAIGWYSAVLHLSPFTTGDGKRNLCPFASAGCIATCLNTAGRGGIMKAGATTNTIQEARRARTLLFLNSRAEFLTILRDAIARHVRHAARLNMKPAIRLNGTSDLAFEAIAPQLFASFPNVQFYDYTKSPARMWAHLAGKLPANYHLTFSRSEVNGVAADELAAAGANVATVFDAIRGHALPATFNGRAVIDADTHDLRFLDPRGVVVGLRAKGKARKDTSGFVQRRAS